MAILVTDSGLMAILVTDGWINGHSGYRWVDSNKVLFVGTDDMLGFTFL